MKKILLLAISLTSFALTKAQTVVSGRLHVTMADSIHHDSTACNVHYTYYFSNITVDTSFVGEVVNLVDTTYGTLVATYTNTAGASPWVIVPPFGWGYLPSDYQALAGVPGTVSYTSPAFKITSSMDTVYISNHDSRYIPNPCVYDTACGRVYIDNNSNCVYDAGDVGIVQPQINFFENLSSTVGSLSWGNSVVSTDGYYREYVQQSWMVNATVSLPSYYAFIFPFSSCFSGSGYYTFTTLPQSGLDFPLQCTSSIDVQTYLLSPGFVRLHRPFIVHPYVSNTGCDTVSGTMTLVLDSHVIYSPSLSVHPADTVRGDTLVWNYSRLTSLNYGGTYWNSFISDVFLSADTTVAAGDTLCFRVYTNIPPADVNPANNDYTVCIPVVYSYDPNIKSVSPAGSGPLGILPPATDSVVYTIGFQNTGSAAAYEVKVIDTLDSHLDPHSLRILGTSHHMTPSWLASNVVEFDYPGIMLPDSSTDEPGSHGQVRFSINLNAGLPPATPIRNKASIYFDANPPVVTNGTLVTTAYPTNAKPIVTPNSIRVYPNPATDQLTVDDIGSGELSVLNMSGSVMLRQNVVSDKTVLDISQLPRGVYMLRAVTIETTTTVKFTKY